MVGNVMSTTSVVHCFQKKFLSIFETADSCWWWRWVSNCCLTKELIKQLATHKKQVIMTLRILYLKFNLLIKLCRSKCNDKQE